MGRRHDRGREAKGEQDLLGFVLTACMEIEPALPLNPGRKLVLCVAGVCRTILGRGKDLCLLYADLDNSTSTGRRLGFEQLAETLEVTFTEPADAG